MAQTPYSELGEAARAFSEQTESFWDSHGIESLPYFKELQETVDLGRLMLSGSHWEVVGEAGHAAVASEHSWIHRGKELVSLLEQHTATQPLTASMQSLKATAGL